MEDFVETRLSLQAVCNTSSARTTLGKTGAVIIVGVPRFFGERNYVRLGTEEIYQVLLLVVPP